MLANFKELEAELEKQANIISDFKNFKQEDERKLVHFKVFFAFFLMKIINLRMN